MELGTGLALLGSAKIVEKLIGPTAAYFGAEIKEFTQRRMENLKKVINIAVMRLGDDIDSPAEVPPLVLKRLIDEGSMRSDEVVLEYLGGVLASSRSPIKRDDRGAAILSLIQRLSTYHLLGHFIIYAAIKSSFNGRLIDLGHQGERNSHQLCCEFWEFCKSMSFEPPEDPDTLISHVLFGLHREQLIDTFFFGYGKDAKEYGDFTLRIDKRYITVTPSAMGVELMLWGTAQGRFNTAQFFAPEVVIPLPAGVILPANLRISGLDRGDQPRG